MHELIVIGFILWSIVQITKADIEKQRIERLACAGYLKEQEERFHTLRSLALECFIFNSPRSDQKSRSILCNSDNAGRHQDISESLCNSKGLAAWHVGHR